MSQTQKRSEQNQIVTRYFNASAPKYMDHYESGERDPYAFQIRRRLVQNLVPPVPGGCALDIGCGPGVMVDFFRNNGMLFQGVDIAESVIEEARRRYPDNEGVRFSVGRIEELNFLDQSFDAVTCMGVLEYLDDDLQAVREMARVLKPGGTMVVTVPNVLAPYRLLHRTVHPALTEAGVRLLKRILGRKAEERIHHREYTLSQAQQMLKDCGMAPLRSAYYGFSILPYPLDRWLEGLNCTLASHLHWLNDTPLRIIGTGFVLSGVKQ